MVGASLAKSILTEGYSDGPWVGSTLLIVADADGAKDTPPNRLGALLLVSVGYSVRSNDTGILYLVAVGRSVGSKVSVAVGNPDGNSASVDVGLGAKDNPPKPLGTLLLVSVGYSFGSNDTGILYLVAVGRSVWYKVSVAVGNPNGNSASVDVGLEEGGNSESMLLDGRNDGIEETDGCHVIDGVSLGLADGPIEGMELEDGATDGAISRTDPLLSTLGALSPFASVALGFLYRSNPPKTAVNPIAVMTATALPPPITTAVILRRRMASGVEARNMLLVVGCVRLRVVDLWEQ